MDNDRDGIVDAQDKCPDKSGVAALDGCPDTDGDGIGDDVDKCPNDAEDKDGYLDDDGCADPDNDADGVPDDLDMCPNQPGATDNDGCPKTEEIQRGSLVLKGVNFATGRASLLPGSGSVLDEVALSLREWPEVTVEIQGHTDSRGGYDLNMNLSRRRAETVRQYLIDKGVSPERLTANGYGPDRPIADNRSADGRARNRRVEIHRD
jgi:outer membrane protein OmpA-like peptidoglycan-associated protein